jgi:hypothetical protein
MQYDGLRFRAECRLAGKLYGQPFGVDVAFGDPILGEPEVVVAEDVLAFAVITPPTLRLYPIETHIAEKLHAYTMPRSRPNSRVKDLPDIALLATAQPIEAKRLAGGSRADLRVPQDARAPGKGPRSARHLEDALRSYGPRRPTGVAHYHGEFGGGIEWFSHGGGPPRSVFIGTRDMDKIVPQNINRAIAAGGAIYVLQGISHMGISEGQLARLWHEHDHFTSHLIARFASEPEDWIRLEDGSWMIATWNAIWHTDERGTNTLVARLPNIVWYPNSFVREADGTLYIGMRGGVLRLTPTWPDMPRYAADLLWPERDGDLSCWWHEEPEE